MVDVERCLEKLQNECNALFESYGATSEIIELQAAINGLRSNFNAPDPSVTDDEGWAQ